MGIRDKEYLDGVITVIALKEKFLRFLALKYTNTDPSKVTYTAWKERGGTFGDEGLKITPFRPAMNRLVTIADFLREKVKPGSRKAKNNTSEALEKKALILLMFRKAVVECKENQDLALQRFGSSVPKNSLFKSVFHTVCNVKSFISTRYPQVFPWPEEAYGVDTGSIQIGNITKVQYQKLDENTNNLIGEFETIADAARSIPESHGDIKSKYNTITSIFRHNSDRIGSAFGYKWKKDEKILYESVLL